VEIYAKDIKASMTEISIMLKGEKIALLKSMNALPKGYSTKTSKELDELIKVALSDVPAPVAGIVAATVPSVVADPAPAADAPVAAKRTGPVLYNQFIKEHVANTGCTRREAQQDKLAWTAFKETHTVAK